MAFGRLKHLLFGLWLAAQGAFAQSAPNLERFVSADYPPAALSAGVEAEVVLRLTIEADGSVSLAEVVTPAGFGFDEAALKAAKQFVFQPALLNEKPTRAQILYRYRFTLQPTGKKASPRAAPLDLGEGAPPKDVLGEDALARPQGFLQGALFVKGSREALSQAEVFLLNPQKETLQEATLSEQNTFYFDSLAPGKYLLKIVAPGYQTLTTEETVPEEGGVELILRLMPSLEDGYGVVVRGETEEETVTRRTLQKEELIKMPGTQGDALRGLQNLPGVARPPAGGGLLIVRGSAPQDTQVFLNGMPIPFLYHLTGLSSVITTALLQQIDFQPGVYSARYGRGMGGIVEVRTALSASETTKATWDLGILDISGSVQGSTEEKSFLVAARRSDIDVFMPLFLSSQAQNFTVIPKYWDYQGALNGKAFDGNWQLLSFGAKDRFSLAIEDPTLGDIFITSTDQFHQLQGFWQRQVDKALQQSASFSVGFNTVFEDVPPFETRDRRSLLAASRLDWATRLTPIFGLRYGADVRLLSYQLKRTELAESFSTLESEITATIPDAGIYVEGHLTPDDSLILTPGLRLDYFGGSDSVTLEPRVQARWQALPKTAFTLAAGIFHEDPRPQDLDPTFGNPNLNPKQSKQAEFGASRSFLSNRIQTNVLFYYKQLEGLLASIGSGDTVADVLGNSQRGRVRGVEFLLKYPPDERFFGWIAYSYSKAERRRDDEDDFVPFFYDQPHVVTMLGSYQLTEKVSVGARFRYSTGVPQTPIIGAVYDADNDFYFPLEGERNSERLPNFHQLDIRVDRSFYFQRWKMTGYLEILNLYNHKNPETTFYNFDYSQSQFINGLPFTPTFGLRGEI